MIRGPDKKTNCVSPQTSPSHPQLQHPARPGSNGFVQQCAVQLTHSRTKGSFPAATAACVYDHPLSSLASERQSAPVVWIIIATHAIIITVTIATLCWMDNQQGIICCDNSTVWKLEMHSPLTSVQNRTNYYKQGSCCILLKLCIPVDLIMITTAYLMMMIIRTIAEMIRVLFPGMNLPLCVKQLCVCVIMSVSQWKWANGSNKKRSYPLKIIESVKGTSSVTFHSLLQYTACPDGELFS